MKIIILAAGQGTRMKSTKAKVLHPLMGKPMILHVIKQCAELSDEKPIVVIGHNAEQIRHYLTDHVQYAMQDAQLGTGHAVMMTLPFIEDYDDVLILCGDMPLIQYHQLLEIKKIHNDKYDAVILTAKAINPYGYGRIIRDDAGLFSQIVEEKDCTPEEKQTNEINSGACLIKGKLLKESLALITDENNQKEYYLTSIFPILMKQGYLVGTLCIDEESIMGINSRNQLAIAENILKRRIIEKHMERGVSFIDPHHTYIEPDVYIDQDVIIYPNCHLRGNTTIGKDCIIYENTTIENSVIGNEVIIKQSVLQEAVIGNNCTIGPFAYLRPKTILKNNVKVGDFVEVKNSTLNPGVKASHLAYIGDASIGKDVNIGCGTVFVNYNGKEKYRTTVADEAFIGSNSNLVAPVNIGKGAYIATGSTITVDVPEGALVVARSREYIKEGWVEAKEKTRQEKQLPRK